MLGWVARGCRGSAPNAGTGPITTNSDYYNESRLTLFVCGSLVGAVGIENNTEWNFKDLEEMLRSAKPLKRNNRKCKGILIGPSMAPCFFLAGEIPSPYPF